MKRLLPILLLVFSVGVGAETISHTFPNGNKYVGEVKSGKKHGLGTFTWASGSKYVGEYKDNKRHGQGTYTFVNGNKYVGEWKGGNEHGQGTFTYASSGLVLTGEWVEGDLTGQGVVTSHGTGEYRGDLKDSKPHGQGTQVWNDGRKYIGEWRDAKKHGQGAFTWLDGTTYVGGWKEGSMHGRGTKIWPRGEKHVGEWKDGKANGQGTSTDLDGTKYVGEWKNGNHWEGFVYSASGEVIGAYKDGVVCNNCRPELAVKKQTPIPKSNVGKLVGTGTGFFVSRNGYIVTNNHVVKGCNQINLLHDGQRASAPLVRTDPRNDLALLKASIRPTAIAYFRSGKGIRAGEDILAFGYPFKSLLSDELKGTKGMVNALSGPNNDTRFMQISAPVQPGNSGGPLLDQSGNVVGVVTARIDAAKMLKERGKIPQNVNFALKASLVRDMLEVKDIDYETASSKRELKTVDIFDRAKKFTVLVECLQ